ncbi:MAG: hypothetical protein RLZZ261_1271 [Bacteroidota bacterium]|jgi:hypothetical protein
MRSILQSLITLCSVTLSAQNYYSAEQAARMLQSQQAKLSELHLKLLARETLKGGYESKWKSLLKDVQGLEGILACADSDWFYQQFEPQLYRTNEAGAEPEAFFAELTKLVALTSYQFEALSAKYAQRNCAQDGVASAVQIGRNKAVRKRPALKGIPTHPQ